jgi:hypothetical protein
MKLSEAVGILNECRHRGGNNWIIAGVSAQDLESVRVARSAISDSLTAFEAIAVAEKYKEGETQRASCKIYWTRSKPDDQHQSRVHCLHRLRERSIWARVRGIVIAGTK